MKKFIVLIALFSIFNTDLKAQVNYDQIYGYDTLFYNCYFGSDPTAFPYLIVVDTGSIVLNSDTIRLGDMHESVNVGIPNTVLWVDSNGILKLSEADSIPLSYNQIVNAIGFTPLNVESDSLITNEGSLTVSAGTGSTSIINSNTSGSTGVTLAAGTGMTISESSNTITLASTAGTSIGAPSAGNSFTMGTAFQPNASSPCMIVVNCSLSGILGLLETITIQISSTQTGTYTTVATESLLIAVLGITVDRAIGTIPVPAGYWVKVNRSGSAATGTYTVFNL